MSTTYKTYKTERYLYFWLAVAAYFLPYIVVAACLMPLMTKAEAGYRVAVGFALVLVNALPFIMGMFKNIFTHYPMLYGLAFSLGICFIGLFFSFNIFAEYADKFLWIEFAVACGAALSCVFWALHRKYVAAARSVKAIVKSGLITQ